jgi:hypothetical protein
MSRLTADGGGSTDGQDLVDDQHRPLRRYRQLLHTGSMTDRSRARQVGQAARTLPATDPCRRWACHGLGGGPAGPGSTGPSPCGSGGGVPPAQLPLAATPAIRQAHRPLLPGPGGPSSPPWLATAGPAPPLTTRCRAPDTAGHRGCKRAARRRGKPDSANRRSAGCTERSCRASASRYICGPCRSLNRAGWRSPRAGRSSGHSRGSPPWPGCQTPTNPPSGRARPSRSRIAVPPYSPAGWSAAHSLGARRPEDAMAVGSSTVALLIA